ncbi:MAG TPA: metallophosphoesterase [Verrucomicrobiae bacterium]|nr:metallophosphoesterase [Verrucomicrobiae bacterium]
MKIVLISDTHGLHNSIPIPNGDVLIHAGDLSPSGTDREISDAARWLGSLPHRHKIAIAGNHDWLFERQPTRASAVLRSGGDLPRGLGNQHRRAQYLRAAQDSLSSCIGRSTCRVARWRDTGSTFPMASIS